MSHALRVANAIAEARLRAAAHLLARGIDEDLISYVYRGGDVCGLNVGHTPACSVIATRESDAVYVDVLWFGEFKTEVSL